MRWNFLLLRSERNCSLQVWSFWCRREFRLFSDWLSKSIRYLLWLPFWITRQWLWKPNRQSRTYVNRWSGHRYLGECTINSKLQYLFLQECFGNVLISLQLSIIFQNIGKWQYTKSFRSSNTYGMQSSTIGYTKRFWCL